VRRTFTRCEGWGMQILGLRRQERVFRKTKPVESVCR